MKLNEKQRQLIVHCLRVAAERFRYDAKTAQDSDLTHEAAKGFSEAFERQSTEADQLADVLEDERLCRYADCPEGNLIANEDEQITCHRCRGGLGLPAIVDEDQDE